MKDQKKTDIKVGLTVIVALMVLIWVLGWAKNFSLNADRTHVNIKFQNVAGLEVGDNVTVNGVRKGFVDGIVTKNDYVIVQVSLDNDVKLKENAVFYVMMLDLMGGKKIEILPGNGDQNLDETKMQYGVFSADIPSVMVMMGKLETELPLMFKQVNVTLAAVNDYLTDKTLQKDIKQTVGNLAILSEQLKAVIDENRASLQTLTTNGAELTSETKDFFVKNKQNLQTTVDGAAELIKKTDKFVSHLDSLVVETKEQKNTAGKFLYDEKLFGDLKETLQNVKELVEILNKQLKNEGVNVKADLKLF